MRVYQEPPLNGCYTFSQESASRMCKLVAEETPIWGLKAHIIERHEAMWRPLQDLEESF